MPAPKQDLCKDNLFRQLINSISNFKQKKKKKNVQNKKLLFLYFIQQ